MSEKACCALGRRADVGAINAALRSGMGVRAVAKLYGVGKTSVGDHRAICLKLDPVSAAPVPPDPPPSPSPRETPKEESKPDGVRGQSGQVSGAPRARLAMDPSEAKSFVEQSLVCADMIAEGKWFGRPSVRHLSALWGLSADAVRDRHQAGVVAAQADRGRIEAERQVAIGAFQEQERIALEAFEASKSVLDEEGNPLSTAGEPKFLAVAQKARAEIAKIAGCVAPPQSVVVNFGTDPAFVAAARRYVETVEGVLGSPAPIVARVSARLGEVAPDVVEAVLDAAADLLAERLAPSTAPALPEAT
jgi:hypothetical protein